MSMLYTLSNSKFSHLYNGDNNDCIKSLQCTKSFIHLISFNINVTLL